MNCRQRVANVALAIVTGYFLLAFNSSCGGQTVHRPDWVRSIDIGQWNTLYVDRKGVITAADVVEGNDEDLRQICKHETIEYLTCDASGLSEEGFMEIRRLARLRALDICPTGQLTGRALRILPELKNLEELWCKPMNDGETALRHIGQCKSLIELGITGTEFPNHPTFSGKALMELGNLKNLRELTISTNPINNEDLRFVPQLPKLQRMSAECENLTDVACEILAECRTLEKVNVCGSGVSGEGLKALRNLPKLRELMIGGTQVQGGDLAILAGFPALERLVLRNLPIDDSHLDPLLKCRNLKQLDVEFTQISKAGIIRLLNESNFNVAVEDRIRKELAADGVITERIR